MSLLVIAAAVLACFIGSHGNSRGDASATKAAAGIACAAQSEAPPSPDNPGSEAEISATVTLKDVDDAIAQAHKLTRESDTFGAEREWERAAHSQSQLTQEPTR